MKIPKEVLEQLPDYRAWGAGKADFDLIDYAMCCATSDLMCAFFELVEPELIQVEGHYFLAHLFDADVYESWQATLPDVRAIQRVMNHIHIASLLQGEEATSEIAVHVARCIARLWSRAFQPLGLEAAAFGETLEDAEVTLFSSSAS